MKPTFILEFPSNLGLKETFPRREPGVKLLPDFLKELGFHYSINPLKTIRLHPPKYSINLDPESKVRNAEKIIEYAKEQSEILSKNLGENYFSLVLGEDCKIMTYNVLSLKKSENYGLFFLDGHTDFMWPELSQTGSVAGMDLAIVAGYGHEKLTNIENLKPFFMEENIFCVGNRDYENWLLEDFLNSKINYFSLEKIRETGIDYCVSAFLKMVDEHRLDGFWIHIDIYVLDDKIIPIVDSRQVDGISHDEFNELIFRLLQSEKAVDLEITILDPELDEGGNYTRGFIHNFCETFNKARTLR